MTYSYGGAKCATLLVVFLTLMAMQPTSALPNASPKPNASPDKTILMPDESSSLSEPAAILMIAGIVSSALVIGVPLLYGSGIFVITPFIEQLANTAAPYGALAYHAVPGLTFMATGWFVWGENSRADHLITLVKRANETLEATNEGCQATLEETMQECQATEAQVYRACGQSMEPNNKSVPVAVQFVPVQFPVESNECVKIMRFNVQAQKKMDEDKNLIERQAAEITALRAQNKAQDKTISDYSRDKKDLSTTLDGVIKNVVEISYSHVMSTCCLIGGFTVVILYMTVINAIQCAESQDAKMQYEAFADVHHEIEEKKTDYHSLAPLTQSFVVGASQERRINLRRPLNSFGSRVREYLWPISKDKEEKQRLTLSFLDPKDPQQAKVLQRFLDYMKAEHGDEFGLLNMVWNASTIRNTLDTYIENPRFREICRHHHIQAVAFLRMPVPPLAPLLAVPPVLVPPVPVRPVHNLPLPRAPVPLRAQRGPDLIAPFGGGSVGV